jgi:hypothetical protein
MARPTHRFFVDPVNNRLLSGVNANATGDRVRFFAGDTARVELHLVRLTGDTAFPAEAVSFADWMDAMTSVSLAVGPLETPPTSGTFKVEFDGDLTDPIPATASAATVEDALNDLPSIVSAGGVSVAKVGEFYRVEFDTNPASELTFETSALVPRSTVISSTPTVGGPARLFRIRQVPVALATTWTAVPSASATLETVSAWDGTNSTVRLTIAEARGGSYNLAFKSSAGTTYPFSLIPFDSSGSALAGFVNSSALTETISVRQIGVGIFDISTPVQPFGVGQEGWTVDGSGLDSFVGLVGDLDFNTVEAETLLDGADSVEVAIEVEAVGGSRYFTAYQGTASLLSDLVDNGPLGPVVLDTPLGTDEAAAIYLTQAAAAVLYLSETSASALFLGKSNNLSDLSSPTTARTNLGLGTMAVASTADYLAKADNLSGLANASTARTNLGLGTMATATATDYLAKSGNLSGLASTATARTNLGLGTMATETATNYLAKADNLSGLANTATARTNLGLGTMATQSASTYLTVSAAASTYYLQTNPAGYLTSASLTGYALLNGSSAFSVTGAGIKSVDSSDNFAQLDQGVLNFGNGSTVSGLSVNGSQITFADSTIQTTAGLTISSLSNSATSTLDSTVPTTGQVLSFDGTNLKWVPAGGGGGGGSGTLSLVGSTLYDNATASNVSDLSISGILSANAATVGLGGLTIGLGSGGVLTYSDGTYQSSAGVPEAPINGTTYGRLNGSWSAISSGGGTDLKVYGNATTAGTFTWTKPAGAKYLEIWLFGAGGGGGSGAMQATTAARSGGGGGGGGAYLFASIGADAVSGSVTITVGAKGTGGASQTSVNIGNNGTNGGDSSFGSFFRAFGGLSGSAGTALNGPGGTWVGSMSYHYLTNTGSGGTGNTSQGATASAFNYFSVPSGGGGGGGQVANVVTNVNGGAGGTFSNGGSYSGLLSSVAGGGAGTSTGTAATNGTSAPTGFFSRAGTGGGGGFYRTTFAGGAGGNGGYPGGGGGGGGAVNSGVSGGSGKGGDGANGLVVVVTYCG